MSNGIYWIGGSSCSGKTTYAKMISELYGFALFNTDHYAFGKYMFGLESIENYPAINNYKKQICEGVDKFINRDTFITYSSFVDYCYEVFPFLLKDINDLSQSNNVIVEGAHLLPELLNNAPNTNNIVFLISTEEQQRNIWLKEMHNEIQGGNENEINDYQNTPFKKQFEDTRIKLHVKIAEHIEKKAIESNLNYIVVDKDSSTDKIFNSIIKLFGLI